MKNRHREEHLGTPVLQHMLAVDFTAAQARSPGSYTNWETLPHGRLQEAHGAATWPPGPGLCDSLEKVRREALDPMPVSSLGYYQVFPVQRQHH